MLGEAGGGPTGSGRGGNTACTGGAGLLYLQFLAASVAQRQSSRLLSGWLEVRVLSCERGEARLFGR